MMNSESVRARSVETVPWLSCAYSLMDRGKCETKRSTTLMAGVSRAEDSFACSF
jgi:hypothetical protein